MRINRSFNFPKDFNLKYCKKRRSTPALRNPFSRAKSPDLTLATVVNFFIAQLESEYGWPVLSVVICLFSFPPVFAIFFYPCWKKDILFGCKVFFFFYDLNLEVELEIFDLRIFSGSWVKKKKGFCVLMQPVKSSKNKIDTDGSDLENDREWSLQVYCYVDTLHNTTSLFFIRRYVDMSSENSKSPESDSNANREKDNSKICRVCGDKALGYNFNAITCESCKAFFRRNALKDKEFKCPFNKKCEINPVTRRFCQLCRLIKCFEIGMRKEYIMSEDDKREKRKKIEQNRAIKKRTVEDVCDSSNESIPKHIKTDNEPEEEDEERKGKKSTVVKINLLNMASTSNKTYQKKQSKYNSSEEQLAPFPSPGVPEPSSPGSSVVTESRTCNVFNQHRFDSNRSRPLEIYQISKPFEMKNKIVQDYTRDTADSSIIKDILNAEVSKPRSVIVDDPQSSYQNEDRFSSFYRNDSQNESEYLLSQEEILELTKNNKNVILESTKDGSKIIVITKNSNESDKFKRVKKLDLNSGRNLHPDRSMEIEHEEKSTPLLSSLIKTRGPSEGEQRGLSFRTDVAEEVLQDIPRNSALGPSNSIETILSEAIKLEYEAYTSMNPRINSRELNDAERAKLNELILANTALLAPLDDDISGLMGEEFRFNTTASCSRPMLVDVLNLTAVAIRRLIKMSKKINAFKNMCQEDQIALLKGGCTEMMILRSAMTYDSNIDCWKIPHSKEKLMDIKVDVLKEAGGKVFEEHQRFLQTFDPKWRNDENIMLILSAITLFTPDRPRVVHYDVIKLEQNSYYYLLRRYLESIFPGCEARSTFLKLIQKISELHKLNEDHVRVYLDVNPKDIEPLLIEIFDLKH